MNPRQEINLYLPGLRPQRDFLSARYCLSGLALVVLGLALLWGLEYRTTRLLKAEISSQQQQLEQLQQQLKLVKQTLPASRASELDDEIAQLRQQLQRRQAINRLIDGRSMGNTEGFSGQMTGLAQSVSKALSISGFDLQQGGKRVAVEGNALQAEEVPLYVEKLRALYSFRDSSFGQLNIRRGEKQGLLNFSFNRDDSDG